MQKIYEIRSLPKVQGFKFRGILENRDLVDCITEMDGDRLQIKDDITGNLISSLIGWVQHLPTKFTY